ncbi:galactokinase [Tundrisphaera sp. TA3]|uniref:galactokinase n=1 Tax=Tundrisphaera sp. TA3 TaxID=3435775 RepID=UPI003EBAC03C
MSSSMPSNEASARLAFAEIDPRPPAFLGRAPGRVELLGNHTDYNGGLVLAAAIDRETVVVGRPTPERDGRIRSANLGQDDAFPLDPIRPAEPGSWRQYIRGVTWAIQEAGGPLPRGFVATLAGNVPLGAGLSSSASLQAALAMFLARVADPGGSDPDDPSRMALAHTLRRSENEFVGVASGLLDQFTSLFGRRDHAVFLDCRTLQYDRVTLGDPAPAIVVCDSKTSRQLADGMYNRRHAECEGVVAHFRAAKQDEAITLLRDVTLGELREEWDRLDPVGRLRARHVLTENDRVRDGAEALRAGDVARFGSLMSASHASSRDDFQNSSPALDALIESAEVAPGFLGGKLSGAGWAGCTVNLVRSDDADAFAEAVRAGYARRTKLVPDVHICHAADGASSRRLDAAP